MKHLNPASKEINNVVNNEYVSFQKMNRILTEITQFVDCNSLQKYHCKCNTYQDFDQLSLDRKRSTQRKKENNSSNEVQLKTKLLSANSITSNNSSSDDSSGITNTKKKNIDNYLHRPSEEYLLTSVNLFQDLFDVDCFASVPTKMNEVYYKYGQLINFKKAVQNIFDPSMKFLLFFIIVDIN